MVTTTAALIVQFRAVSRPSQAINRVVSSASSPTVCAAEQAGPAQLLFRDLLAGVRHVGQQLVWQQELLPGRVGDVPGVHDKIRGGKCQCLGGDLARAGRLDRFSGGSGDRAQRGNRVPSPAALPGPSGSRENGSPRTTADASIIGPDDVADDVADRLTGAR